MERAGGKGNKGEPRNSGTGRNGGDKREAMMTMKTVYTGASETRKCGCIHFSVSIFLRK